MKPPNKFSILVWFCNLLLVALAVVIIGSGYYLTLVPSLIGLDKTFEGATKYSANISQNFLSDYYTFEQVYNKEEGIERDSYYFATSNKLYKIPLSDSVSVEVHKIDQEQSYTEYSFPLVGTKKEIRVTDSAGKLPVQLAALAIPLNRDQFKNLAQLNVVSFILYAVYTFLFVWFLRKFVAGLKEPGFFNRINARRLYITAGLVTLAPLLMWAWEAWVRPDFYSEYLIDNSYAIDTSSSLPPALFSFGIILLVIAWCFDQGVKLQKEQELTI